MSGSIYTSKKLSLTAAFLAMTIVIQFLGLPQFITGPVINAVLAAASILVGFVPAVFLGCVTPAVALFRGQLPAVLAPMVPFIALGNSVFILLFGTVISRLHEKGSKTTVFISGLAVVSAALAKTLVLYGSITVLVPLLFGIDIPPALAYMMATPQFITAVIGGVTALVFIRILHNSLSITT